MKVTDIINYFAKYNIPLDKIYSNGKTRGLRHAFISEAIEWFLSIKPDTLCTCNHRDTDHTKMCNLCGCEKFMPQVRRARIVWAIWEKAEEFQSAGMLREHLDEYKRSHELIEEKKVLLKENTNLKFSLLVTGLSLIACIIYIF